MNSIKEIINDIDHNLGIFLITIAFIYLLIETIRQNKSIVPRYFSLLYAIGGFLIMNEMITQTKTIVVIMELIGASISLYLFFYSFYH